MASASKGPRKQHPMRVPLAHMEHYERMAKQEGVSVNDVICRLAAMQAGLEVFDWMLPRDERSHQDRLDLAC